MRLLWGLDEVTHAKTLEVCLILKYSKSPTLHEPRYHLFPFFIFPIFIFIFIFIFFCFILSSSSSSSSSPPYLLHFFLPSSSSPFSYYYYLLVYFYPFKSHPTRLLTQLHYDEHRKDQDKHLDGCSTFGNPPAWLTGARTTSSHTISPVFCIHPFAITHVANLISLRRNPFALPLFCSKSQPERFRTEFLGVEKGRLGCGDQMFCLWNFFQRKPSGVCDFLEEPEIVF